MNVEFEGAEKLMARLDKMSDEAALKKSLETAALLVERSAREKAPKDTGALRRSIRSKVEGLEGIVYTPLEYAPYIYVWSLNRAKSGKPKQLKYHTI